MVINYSAKYLESLACEIEKFLTKEMTDSVFKIVKLYLPNENYESRMKTEKKEFQDLVLVRPQGIKQKVRNGIVEKVQTYLVRVFVKNVGEHAEGYAKVTEVSDLIISHFTNKPLATQERDGYSYHVNLGEIQGELNDDLTAGDYWTYDIYLNLDIQR